MKFEKLFRFNRKRFWKEVAKFKKTTSFKPKNVSLKSFEIFYKDLFSAEEIEKTHNHSTIEDQTKGFYSSIKDEIFEYSVSEFEINSAIKNLKVNKAVGYDAIPAEMLIFSNSTSLKKILRRFYSIIFSYGYIPNDFNVSIVTPIPKSKSNNSEPGDFRPISVSS
jgi:hypothetical protein